MKLVKLLAYCALGYLIYEFYQGLAYGEMERSGPRRSGDLKRALNEDAGRMNMSGPARGESVETEDNRGARSRKKVGRGVVKR